MVLAGGGVRLVLVAMAGAAGALTRYGIGTAAGGRSFPWATLGINVAGSFLLAALMTAATERGWPASVTTPLGVGFLGAFTTFSTFSNETVELARTGRTAAAALYVAASLALGVLAAAAGHAAGRAWG